MPETIDDLMPGVAPNVTCALFFEGEWSSVPASVPAETPLTIYVNGQELVTILCTPSKLNCLVIGFLYSEGIIASAREVASMRVCEDEPIADVRLSTQKYKAPQKRTLTSGCGGGASFGAEVRKVESGLVVTPQEVLALMKQLLQQQKLYQRCGGIHCSALCDRKQVLVSAEDIGRHNTLDKILGECLLRGLPTRDHILLTTGRISSEMLLKAVKMQTPIVVSRRSPTERAILLGRDLGIAIAGYVRGDRLSVFSGEERFPVTDCAKSNGQ